MLSFVVGAIIPMAALYLMNWRWAVTGLGLAVFCGALVMIFSPTALQGSCANALPCAVADVSARLQLALNMHNILKLPGLQGG